MAVECLRFEQSAEKIAVSFLGKFSAVQIADPGNSDFNFFFHLNFGN
jgi:hypothetical protein